MKKIISFLSVILVIGMVSSCNNEDYSGMNITKLEEEIIIPEFDGDLSSQIVIKNADGEVVDNVNMGEAFYILDNTEGGADGTKWTLSQTSTNTIITSEKQFERIMFGESGDVNVSLESVRSSDGKSITDEITMGINWIPVTASFVTDPVDNGGVITILQGDTVRFSDRTTGMPESWEWTLPGGQTESAVTKDVVMRYDTPGTFDVTLKSTRDDSGNLVESTLAKPGLVVVEERIVKLMKASIVDNKLDLVWSEPFKTLPADAVDQFSIRIEAADGEVINPAILRLDETGSNSIQLTFDDKMYSDDIIYLTFTPKGNIIDETGLIPFPALTDEICSNGKNLYNEDHMAMETDQDMWKDREGPTWKITDEVAYRGMYSMMINGDQGGWAGVESTHEDIPDLELGKTYTWTSMVYRDTRTTHWVFATWILNAVKNEQYWNTFKDKPLGEWFYVSMDKTIAGEGPTQISMRCKGGNWLYIDNFCIVEKDPRP